LRLCDGVHNSTDFPKQNTYQSTSAGLSDVFVTKIDPSQTGTASLIYSTYLGGTSGEVGQGIAVDGSGNVYVTGGTNSTDFPTRLDSFQPHFSGVEGTSEAFIVKLIPGEPDFTPPTFTVLTQAYKETQPVPYPVSFQVQIQDPSGVYYNPADPAWSIILRQRNALLDYTYNPQRAS